MNQQMLGLSNDTIAVLEVGAQSGGTTVRFFDAAQGRPIGEPFQHSLEIKEIQLSQVGTSTERQLILIDRNRDLYIVGIMKRQPAKLASMVDSALWHNTTGMLAALVDQKLTVWYYPNEVFVDKEMLAKSRFVKADAEFGKAAHIQVFTGHLQDPSMWATLASMAMANKELNTAEAAFAEVDEVDKLHFVMKLKQVPHEEGRNAELALYRRKPDEAEAILIQAGLTYRAIKLNIKLFRWDRALDLAQQYNQHIDTVLWYRQRYLSCANGEESNERFIELNDKVAIDEQHVRQHIQEEKTAEAERPGAKRYVS
ncbi:hypothetical protein DUNSADRAFT_15000 [Dunaliella salina]|uniref:Clathrin heavy chain n=1 Tax=Dunaliella salina TaxID=3046 RepID=A0ABQ7G697_DUNSA|nr:hypothetical protein DUNSADRAFT_15000 [Dunaliella salina]|eukprot:KAF5830134.1 hypothetical protein DUNSADRAFT_15000 [Dunaliella salina]